MRRADVLTNALDRIFSWFLDPEIQTKIVGSLAAAIVLAALTWLTRRFFHAAQFMFGLFAAPPYTAELRRYRQRLDEDSLFVRHAWMKEGQTLKDILVPVGVEGTVSNGGIEDLTVVLSKVLSHEPPVRAVVLIGGPGTGKSVALRVAARHTSRLVHAGSGTPLVPVLLTFSSYRHAEFKLVDALVESLQARSFQPPKGPDGGALARQFVVEYLASGRLLIFVDALDELDVKDRMTALHRLALELKTYEKVRVALSCRTAAWRGQLDDVPFEALKMAEFTSPAIRQFVTNWGFRSPKSAEELLSVIRLQPHIADLARNPLMLTIIAFLYSQPKYRLPDNRAQFYEVCSLALLQEWDQAQNPERANRYDRPHKENLLGCLAYEHMCGPNPDQDIEEDAALESFAKGMHELGLVRSENARMLDEIVLNSGLLVRLPPTGLRFPHQTFLEFFAALHLLRQAGPEALLNQYRGERTRWREVLLLYCGINADMTESAKTMTELLAWDSVEPMLAALTDARAVPRPIAEQVLMAAEQKIASEPTAELINHLGYFSANPQSAYADRAATYLAKLLDEAVAGRFPGHLLESLLLAVLRRPTEATTRFVVDHIEELDLRRILPAMGERALVIATTVVAEPGLAVEKKLEWIDGLRRAGAVRLLYRLAAMKDVEDEVRKAAAIALVRTSRTADFWQAVDDPETPTLVDPSAERVYLRWGWPFGKPATEKGRRTACYLASALADALRDGSYAAPTAELQHIHGQLLYLTAGVYRERRYERVRPWPKEPTWPMDTASVGILCSVWRKAASVQWTDWVSSAQRALGGTAVFTSLLVLGSITAAWSLIGSVLYASVGADAGGDRRVAALYASFVISFAWLLTVAGPRVMGWMKRSGYSLVLVAFPAIVLAAALDAVVSAWTRRHLWHAWGVCVVSIGLILLASYTHGSIWFRVVFLLTPLQFVFVYQSCFVDLALPPMLANKATQDLFDFLRQDT